MAGCAVFGITLNVGLTNDQRWQQDSIFVFRFGVNWMGNAMPLEWFVLGYKSMGV